MTCYSPLRAYRAREGRLVFNRRAGLTGASVDISCGQCLGCRLARSRQWAIRCMHEAKMYEENCFLTLTYSPLNLPEGNTLVVKHFQDFMKRFRWSVSPTLIRFYACGEYGERYGRPHYHACIFNYNFPDRKPWKKSDSGELQYRSEALEKLWPFGHSSLGSVTFKSAAYCARYIMQKATGDDGWIYEPHTNPDTGEVFGSRVPPFNIMSRRPGIGHSWFKKFVTDAYPSDYLILEGRKVPVPHYYDTLYERDGGDIDAFKRSRKVAARAFAADTTPDRLKVRAIVKEASLKRLTRNVE